MESQHWEPTRHDMGLIARGFGEQQIGARPARPSGWAVAAGSIAAGAVATVDSIDVAAQCLLQHQPVDVGVQQTHSRNWHKRLGMGRKQVAQGQESLVVVVGQRPTVRHLKLAHQAHHMDS